MPGIARMPRPEEKGCESKEGLLKSCESVYRKALEKNGFRRIDDSGKELRAKTYNTDLKINTEK